MVVGSRAARNVGYVLRCVVAASLSVLCARALGMGHPIWVTVSALIVSQEQVGDIRRSLGGRAVGTALGVATALAAGVAAEHLPDPQFSAVAMASCICAIVARERPAWRVCLWTAPIILLTTSTAEPLAVTAFYRATEVLLGAAIGAATHEISNLAVRALIRRVPGKKNTVPCV